MSDRSWIFCWKDEHGLITVNFQQGVDEFLKFAYEEKQANDYLGHIRCSCTKCNNSKFKDRYNVEKDLYQKGFSLNYFNWNYNDEEQWMSERPMPLIFRRMHISI